MNYFGTKWTLWWAAGASPGRVCSSKRGRTATGPWRAQPESSLAALSLPTSSCSPTFVGSGSQLGPASLVPARGAKSKPQKKPTGKNLQVTQGRLLLMALNEGRSLGEKRGNISRWSLTSLMLEISNFQATRKREFSREQLGLQDGSDVAPLENP